ncbi:MAG: arginine deiminase family protein [Rhodobacteraceae bacterium]|nr:arginine deiminase family protein [Paracoccaceae bacterium]
MSQFQSPADSRLHSETDRLTDVLLCRPDHYEWIPTNAIARATLATGRPLNRQSLMAEYGEFEAALAEAGVRCHYLTPDPILPYQVYTRDSSQTAPGGPVLTMLAMPQRRGEYKAVLDFFGQGMWRMATAGTVEGGDIHLIRPGLACIGHSGGRTSQAGAVQFAEWLTAEGWEARLVPFDDHFLHLDVIFSMVTDDLALVCPDALPPDFLDWLAAHGIRRFDVSYGEAMADMACNLLALGDGRVLSPRHSQRTNAALRAEGITVYDPELRLFAHGGGSAHCMSMPLWREAGVGHANR